MQRFMGMMPMEEVKETHYFKDRYGDRVMIDVGDNGWTVYYADMSNKYADESIGTKNNYIRAYTTADADVGPLTPLTHHHESYDVDCDNEFDYDEFDDEFDGYSVIDDFDEYEDFEESYDWCDGDE